MVEFICDSCGKHIDVHNSRRSEFWDKYYWYRPDSWIDYKLKGKVQNLCSEECLEETKKLEKEMFYRRKPTYDVERYPRVHAEPYKEGMEDGYERCGDIVLGHMHEQRYVYCNDKKVAVNEKSIILTYPNGMKKVCNDIVFKRDYEVADE